MEKNDECVITFSVIDDNPPEGVYGGKYWKHFPFVNDFIILYFGSDQWSLPKCQNATLKVPHIPL